MLYLIKNITDGFLSLIGEDPVRPHIPPEKRVGENKDIFVLRDVEDSVRAITCVSYQNDIPLSESELFISPSQPEVAVFYTIWSYAPGAGRSLIYDAVNHIKQQHTNIKRFVTLSPKTELARRFHIKNGAIIYRENVESINYEYTNL